MNNQEAVQGGNTIPVSISIPANTTAAAARQSFMQLIAASSSPKLTTAQLAQIIGGVVTARQPQTGSPPSSAPTVRSDFSFGFSDGTPGTGLNPANAAGIADAGLVDYCGVGEELDLKGVDWLRTTVPLSLSAGAVTAVVRVYFRI